MLIPISVSEHVDFLFQSIFYLLTKNQGKKSSIYYNDSEVYRKGTSMTSLVCRSTECSLGTKIMKKNHWERSRAKVAKVFTSGFLCFKSHSQSLLQIKNSTFVHAEKRYCLTPWNQLSGYGTTSNPLVAKLFPDKIYFFTQILQYFVPQHSISISCLRGGSNSLKRAVQV